MATYYVSSSSGSDGNPGTDSQPFRTLTFAYALTNPGDTIIVKDGTYTDHTANYGFRLNRNGTSASPITVRAQNQWGAILDGQNLSSRPEVVYVHGAWNILDGFLLKNGFKGGIKIFGNNNRFQRLEIANCGNSGDLGSSFGQDGIFSDKATSGNQYLRNYIHHNGRLSIDSNLDHGLYLCGNDELIANNIIAYNCAYGLHVAGYDGISGMKVYNNTMARNGRSGMIVWQTLVSLTIKNNIFYKNRQLGFTSYAAHGSGVVLDRNNYFGNPSGTRNFTNGGSDYSFSNGVEFLQDPMLVNVP